MTYRRVSARPVYIDPKIIKLMRIIFWNEYSNILTPNMVVINIDETLFLMIPKSTIHKEWRMSPTILAKLV